MKTRFRNLNYKKDIELLCKWDKDLVSISRPYVKCTEHFKEQFKKDIKKSLNKKSNKILIFEYDKKPIGYIWLEKKYHRYTQERVGHISQIYLIKEHRGKGFGNLLMKKAEEFFKKHNIKKIGLTVTVSNERAIRFYKKSGFKIKRYEMENKNI